MLKPRPGGGALWLRRALASEKLGSAGSSWETSKRQPMITVRSRGRWKYSAASAVICAVARKRRLRQRVPCRARCPDALDRREEVRQIILVQPAFDVGLPDQRKQRGNVPVVHVAEARGDVRDPVVSEAEIVDDDPLFSPDVRDRAGFEREDDDA